MIHHRISEPLDGVGFVDFDSKLDFFFCKETKWAGLETFRRRGWILPSFLFVTGFSIDGSRADEQRSASVRRNEVGHREAKPGPPVGADVPGSGFPSARFQVRTTNWNVHNVNVLEGDHLVVNS